jgi:hypothetical protein
MATSQNGWPVVGQSAVVDRAVRGVEFPNGWLKGDVDTVFTYLIERLDDEVEPIDRGGCWGWFVKKIEGSQTISNHASGTAIDYNAPAHPMGRRDTYSEADQERIRAILKDLDGVVRWGGDYSGRPDDMHFEINRNAIAVRAVAQKIRTGVLPVALTPADKNWISAEVTRIVDARVDELTRPTVLTGPDGDPDGTYSTPVGHNSWQQGVPNVFEGKRTSAWILLGDVAERVKALAEAQEGEQP